MGICRAANVSLMIELIFMQRNYCMPNLFTTKHVNEDKTGGSSKPLQIKCYLGKVERASSGKVL